MRLSNVELYTDGSCLRNPGMGGLGYIIRYTEDDPNNDSVPMFKEIESNQGFRYTTNNRMEIMAVIYGIKDIIARVNDTTIQGCTQVNVFSDSEIFCGAINQGWLNRWVDNNWMTSGYKDKPPYPVKNRDLWEQVISVQDELKHMNIIMTVTKVKGHDGHEFNERADKLAVSASTGTNHIIDEVFEKVSGLYQKK